MYCLLSCLYVLLPLFTVQSDIIILYMYFPFLKFVSDTEDSLTTSRIFTEIATKEILQSTSQVEELRTMISAVDNVDKSASNDSFPIFSTDPDILPATLLTTPSTNVDAISDLFTELTSVTDGIWISETPQKEETSTFSSPTTSEGSLQTTSNISAPNSIVTSEKDSGGKLSYTDNL